MDPDPRSRPDPDPAGGLRSLLATTPEAASAVAAIEGAYPAAAAGDASTGAGGAGAGAGQGARLGVPASVAAAAEVMQRVLEDPGSSSSHPVLKDDFAMGGLAMPALTGGCHREGRREGGREQGSERMAGQECCTGAPRYLGHTT